MEDPLHTSTSDGEFDSAGGRRGMRCAKLLGCVAIAALVASGVVIFASLRTEAGQATTPAPTVQQFDRASQAQPGGGAGAALAARGGIASPGSDALQADLGAASGTVPPASVPGSRSEEVPLRPTAAPAVPRPGGSRAAGGAPRTGGECFLNHTFFTELSGKHAMPSTGRSVEASPANCQLRCVRTPGCEHFSFWSDGGCLLTSFTAYHETYRGSGSLGVVSGPRDCASVMPETVGPTLELEAALGLPAFVAQEAAGCGSRHSSYDLAWKAEGRTFFDDFQFTELSETHGAEWYLNKTEAFRLGVVATSDTNAILRVGDQVMPFKRRSVMLRSARAWRPDQGFVVAMKYRHVPYGAGIWPAFWLMNSDYLWPKGGELDILEYANDAESKVTFHSDKNCSLDAAKLDACMRGPGVDRDVVPSCYTNYTGNQLGCKPPQVRRTGRWFAEHPGVIATVWDPSGISVFHIPEAEVPPDLQGDRPNPNSWERWMLAYLPFDPSSCVDIARPQEIVLNIALCGDWAGGAWRTSEEARSTGFLEPYCIAGHVSEPATDCCTIFMSSPKAEEYLKTRAFFDIEYIKVFEPAGAPPSNLSSGTYRNDGIPLREPCVPCGQPRWIAKGSHSRANVCCPGCDANATKYWWNNACDCGGTLVCGPQLP